MGKCRVNMKALIIAAGQRSQLNDLTKDKPKSLIQLLGLSLIERVILTAKQAGINEFVIVIGYHGEKIKEKLGDGKRYEAKITYIENREWQSGDGASVLKAKELLNENFVLLMANHIVDSRILEAIVNTDFSGAALLAIDRSRPSKEDTKVLEKNGKIIAIGKEIKNSNGIATGIFVCAPKIFYYLEKSVRNDRNELKDGIGEAAKEYGVEIFDIMNIESYVPHLRKKIPPFWKDTNTEKDLREAEHLLIENTCRGTNDLLALYFNKPIENFIVSKLANTKITPNQVTFLTNLLAYVATFLFFYGYLLPATLITFVVSLLDGVDGKLARVKLLFSKFGRLEHAFDYLFEHSWYIALALYLIREHGILPLTLCAFILFFDGFVTHITWRFEETIGVQLYDYSKPERIFRRFDGRKNSYIILILIGVLLGVPLYSLIAMTVLSLASAIFYGARATKHLYKH